MRELELSVMEHNVAVLQPLLDRFEEKTRIRVHLQVFSWYNRAEMQRFALYNRGPDVSEIGTTWVSDFVAMNALRPFSEREFNTLLGEADALPVWLETSRISHDPRTWAVPLFTESHLIYYRKDMLRKAGVDVQNAFSTHAQLNQTAAQLAQAGMDIPVVPIYLYEMYITLHALASWIWTAGGEFCTPDGLSVTFDQPEALKALVKFYQFGRSLSEKGVQTVLAQATQTSPETAPRLFYDGLAAMAVGTLDFRGAVWNQLSAGERENWGAAPLPGQHFTGGSNLVVWQYTRHVDEALELVRYLTSPAVLMPLALGGNRLPANLSLFAAPEIANDPILSVMAEAIKSGRTYRSIPLWGLVEDRYIRSVMQVGRQLISDLNCDAAAYVSSQIEAVARRLNITLAH